MGFCRGGWCTHVWMGSIQGWRSNVVPIWTAAGALVFEVWHAVGLRSCHSSEFTKYCKRIKPCQNVLFKFFLASLKKSKVILIFWSVNFHSGNMVRDWQTELSAKESDLRQSLQISQISIWIGSISEWCNFDHHTSHSGRRFSEKNWWRWDLICDCCESLGRGFTPSGLLGLCWPQPIRGWEVEHWAGSPLGFYYLMISMLSLAFSRHSLLSWGVGLRRQVKWGSTVPDQGLWSAQLSVARG